MFDRLPPELVRQIIESAIPSTFLSSNYAERQANLQAFCLVSRYLRQETLPLLFQYIRARNSSGTLNEALIAVQSKAERSKGWTRCTRQVSIECSGSLSPIKSRFERLARNGQGLRVLTLANLEETVNLALLTQLPQLRDLRLFGKSFKINSRFVLPKVESMTVDLASLDTLLPRLRPASLPALRNFALPYSYSDRPGRLSELLKDTSFRHLVDQVNALFIDSRLIESSALNDFQPFFRKTLVSFNRYDLARCARLTPRLEHVQFGNFDIFVGFARHIYYERSNQPASHFARSILTQAIDTRLFERHNAVRSKNTSSTIYSQVSI